MSPIASFDVNAREALSNPHQAAIDVKKPAGLVPYGLSVLHRTYPDHYLVELAGVEPASEIPTYHF
ncbi:hypothetical protein DQY65_21030 [Salmonella enterica subsp. enterica serovar Chester]|uniref:Uncharacterized protein n=1 Tax=Salmonella enterica subsp. enterica serovar Chester TaxID=149386 RepID=A0A5H7AHF5_SALET|nr:hypothetical protein SEECH997_005580 [Salmonella enterica subsp. enterica serovar Chester str. ATCC 11997]EAA1855500.1 hypothetical protein [Salmonella enterica subsp. enterica serovar Chester]EBA1512765.1 hypothetical protein [Salmonella enterica]ECC3218482.1 hypothetical protein [Salmonella enterica subsp. enterica]EDR6078169.1 hypothetical protein [Salmonella enterica subsp. enterica serovar Barranquilla]